MTGLDTNILLRFLTQDEPAQSAVVERVLSRLTEDRPGFVSVVVLAEIAWVLRSSYGFSQVEIGEALSNLAGACELAIESEPEALFAIDEAKDGAGDLADILIASLGRKAGCLTTLTFDKDASRLAGFELAK